MALAVVLVVLVATGGFFGVRALTGDSDTGDETAVDNTEEPSEEATQEPSESESADPTEEPSGDATEEPSAPSSPAGEPCLSGSPTEREDHPKDGAVYGGGLTMPVPQGYRSFPLQSTYTFASDVETVARDLPGNYVATFALGEVSRTSFPSVQSASQQVALCIVESRDFYPPSAVRSLGDSEAATLDGQDAWSSTVRMRLDGAAIPGGVVRVVAVDLDDPDSFGLFVAIMPIGDRPLIVQRDRVTESVLVDD